LSRLLARLAIAMVAGGCASAPPEPARPAAANAILKNGDFAMSPLPGRDCPPQWWCTVHADPSAFRFGLETDPRSGARQLRVERVKNEPWALVSQFVPGQSLVGKRIRLSVSVDAALVEGEGAGLVLILRSIDDRVLGHGRRLQARSAGWQSVAVELDVAPGTAIVSANLAVEGGGVARFDDARLEVLGPAAAGR
jgi:hypothetical protein